MSAINETAFAVGIDVGTSGARAAAITASGRVVAFSASPFATAAETRSPGAWWHRVSECLHALADQTDLGTVQGLAVDGTSGTLLALDRLNQPTGDVLMYNEPCLEGDIVRRIEEFAPKNTPAQGANSGLARAIHLSGIRRVASVLHQADWVMMKLGLNFAASDENNALKTGYDLESERWPEWIAAAGMDTAKLPSVFRAGRPVGVVGPEAAKFGFNDFCRIHAGTTDGCASFLATGASQIGDGVTALGSTMVLKLASEHPVDAPEFGIYAHRVLGFWLVGGASNSGGAVIRTLIGDNRLDELTRLLMPETPTGLNYYPLLKPGERFPFNDPLYAPRLDPRPADDAVYFQAILEGITEIERIGYSRLQSLGAPQLKTLRTVGGGARNPAWTAMREKALGLQSLPPWSSEAAVGTASLVLAQRQAGI